MRGSAWMQDPSKGTWLHAARPLQLTFRPFAILARSSSASSLLLSSSSACPMQPKPPDDDGADSNCTRHALGATIFSTAADTSASHTPWRRPTKSSVVCISGCGSSSCPIRKVKTTSPKDGGPSWSRGVLLSRFHASRLPAAGAAETLPRDGRACFLACFIRGPGRWRSNRAPWHRRSPINRR